MQENLNISLSIDIDYIWRTFHSTHILRCANNQWVGDMKIRVTGIVQGVGFRPQVTKVARSLNLKGYVKNVGSFVEIYLEDHEDEFLEAFKRNIPPLAKIDSITVHDEPPTSQYEGFAIIRSSEGYKNYMFPADTAVCEECLQEMFDEKNRRYLYPFTNCVNCGARYSVTYDLPYDRDRTSMRQYDMCEKCEDEFNDTTNRRYDAQTLSCGKCGPKYKLYDTYGAIVSVDDPIREYARIIDEGNIGVAKSWGGMHISTILENAERFRKWYKRPTKPFAVMVRDIETARKYAKVAGDEERLLLSKQRPIVLLEKKDLEDPTLDLVSPSLPNIGLYLPYAGLHQVLFHYLNQDAIINTSGNFPNEPMVVDNKEIFELKADYYLLHDREIVNRIDDTLVRSYEGRTFFIRKSRGYVPDIMKVDYGKTYLSLGAEMNSRISISKDGYIFSSQYLGDISYYKSLEFMESTVHRFMKMLDVDKLDGIAIDKHPQFSYRKFATELAEPFGLELQEIQHHHAHSAGLLFENSSDRMVVLALDGTGYGTDGKVWGGEILDSTLSGFERIASLEEFPLPGGESAIKNPNRIIFGINEMLGDVIDIPYDRELYSKIIRKSVKTTSFGRVLDALSAYLGICDLMRYDGEPAMKLEKYLNLGNRRFDMHTESENFEGRKIVKILPLFQRLFELKINTQKDKADAAYSFVYALLEKMAEIAEDHAESHSLDIGLTGGVSYNFVINEMLRSIVGDKNLKLHNSIPNGDGGISAGQNFIISKKLE